MKRTLIVALACLFLLAGCGKKASDVPALSQVQENGPDWALEQLTGCSHEDLKAAWGEPSGQLSGFWGEVWFLDAEHTGRVTVYYDADGRVESLLMDTAPGLEPEKEQPTGVAPPEPDKYAYELLDSPPELTVICGGERLETASCGFTWVTENGILCADAPTPLQMKKNMAKVETVEEAAVLVFEMEPDAGEVVLRAWDDGCTDDCDCAPVEMTLGDDMAFELLPGGYIYEVVAKWGDGETAGGTAVYAFYIDKLYPQGE